MQTGMLGNSEALRRLWSGPLLDLAGKLNSEGGPEWETALGKFLRKENPWPEKPLPGSLLAALGTITIPASREKFIAKKRFVVDTRNAADVKISYLGGNFREWFCGKTESPGTETVLGYHRLNKSSVDGPIIAELGGEAKAETTLRQFFSVLKQRGKGGSGPLLASGGANIFYIRDINGVLRAVHAHWYAVGWFLDAIPVENPIAWDGGGQVFSRNS